MCGNIYRYTLRKFTKRLITTLGTNMGKMKNERTRWPGGRSKRNMRRMKPAGNGKPGLRTDTNKIQLGSQPGFFKKEDCWTLT